MSSHFNAVGYPVGNIDEYWALARRAAASGVRNTAPDGSALVRWAADSGPEIWSHVSRAGDVVGATPFYSTGTAYRISITGAGEDPDEELEGWIDGWLEPAEDDEPFSGAFPLRVNLVNYILARPRLTTFPTVQRLELVGLAHEADLFTDEQAYTSAPSDAYHVPIGAFVSGPHFAADADAETFTEATGLLAAPIDSARLLTNPSSGQSYWWMEVTVRGIRLHTFADRETLGGDPSAGQILAGSFWLLGRLL